MDNNQSDLLIRIRNSDVYFSFKKSPTAIISSIILAIIFFCSFFVELVVPYNPFDPSSLSLMEAFTPPSWTEDGLSKFILGTDGQGRDMLSTILYGSRISLIVGFSAILFSLVLGVALGLTAGYFGGKYEMFVMRLTDVQLTVPSILMALLVDGIARGIISREMHDEMAIYVLIFAIGISEWPQFARVSRAATLVEKNKDYVAASTIIGVSNLVVMFKHILPNIMRPILVIGTIGLALAILAEATLRFLGVEQVDPGQLALLLRLPCHNRLSELVGDIHLSLAPYRAHHTGQVGLPSDISPGPHIKVSSPLSRLTQIKSSAKEWVLLASTPQVAPGNRHNIRHEILLGSYPAVQHRCLVLCNNPISLSLFDQLIIRGPTLGQGSFG